MFAVRKALASADGRAPRRRRPRRARASSTRPRWIADDPLGFLLGDGGAASLPEAAYRFARHEPGCHVVLTGTGSVDHLAENVASINGPPLPADHLPRLQALFGHIDSVTGD